jgi:hypothetical protein
VYGFKPRFVLDNARLQLIPVPTLSYSELGAFFANPGLFLQSEAFLPDSTYGPVRFQFPYSLSLFRALAKERTRLWLRGEPTGKEFFQPGHPTRSMETTVEIASRFQDLCNTRTRKCLVVIFPTPSAYRHLLRTGELVTSLLDLALEERSIRVLDLTESLVRTLPRDGLCAILSEPNKCRGHFNAAGNRMIADIVYAYLRSEALLPVRLGDGN